MINLVEMMDDEQRQAPCRYGNIVVGHACYCHNGAWEDGPRKCPIWREFGEDAEHWFKRDWELVSLPMLQADGKTVLQQDMPCMPDDRHGGCPKFEPA